MRSSTFFFHFVRERVVYLLGASRYPSLMPPAGELPAGTTRPYTFPSLTVQVESSGRLLYGPVVKRCACTLLLLLLLKPSTEHARTIPAKTQRHERRSQNYLLVMVLSTSSFLCTFRYRDGCGVTERRPKTAPNTQHGENVQANSKTAPPAQFGVVGGSIWNFVRETPAALRA